MRPYSDLEKNYLIEERVQSQIEKHGSVEKALTHCKSELEEYEKSWSQYSCDCLGHAITCKTLLISRLEELKTF